MMNHFSCLKASLEAKECPRLLATFQPRHPFSSVELSATHVSVPLLRQMQLSQRLSQLSGGWERMRIELGDQVTGG